MKVIKVWQASKSDGCGVRSYPSGVYNTRAEAMTESDFPDNPYTKPEERAALMMDNGKVWLLEGEPMEFTNIVRDKRAAALAKLTSEEREILGVK